MTEKPPTLDPALLGPDRERFRRIDDGQLPSNWQYLNMRGSYELAAAFASLFWPEFVEIDGCVVIKESLERSSSTFEEWKEACKGDRRCIEVTLNHVHVWDLFFPNASAEHLDDKLGEFIGRVLERSWTAAAREAFPDREIFVEYTDDPEDGPTVTLYQASRE